MGDPTVYWCIDVIKRFCSTLNEVAKFTLMPVYLRDLKRTVCVAEFNDLLELKILEYS